VLGLARFILNGFKNGQTGGIEWEWDLGMGVRTPPENKCMLLAGEK